MGQPEEQEAGVGHSVRSFTGVAGKWAVFFQSLVACGQRNPTEQSEGGSRTVSTRSRISLS